MIAERHSKSDKGQLLPNNMKNKHIRTSVNTFIQQPTYRIGQSKNP